MDTSKVVDMLRDVECEFIDMIARTDDFEKRSQCLELAQQARDLAGDCALLQRESVKGDVPTPHTIAMSTLYKKTKEEESGLPVYFVYEGILFKIGAGRNENLYKKTVPFQDALTIIDGLIAMLDDSDEVRISDVFLYLPAMGEGKIQVTMMASVEAGILKQSGRGKYALMHGRVPRRSTWESKLKDLPVRSDLVTKVWKNTKNR